MQHFSTALHWTFGCSTCISSANIVDMVRLLAQAQEFVSTEDVESCASNYYGTPQGLDLILSQTCELEDVLAQAGCFATAVRNHGTGDRAWEPIIRKFIRKGVDIHGLIFQDVMIYSHDDSEQVWAYGTPLDELFQDSRDPVESKESAHAWLQILSSEEIDVQAYLMEEIAIHVAQNQLTWANWTSKCSRRLCYETGETPSVWWEWCPSSYSRIPLVQAEYSQISFDLGDNDLGVYCPVSWQDRWPFDHPQWSDDPRMWEAPQSRFWDWGPSSEWWQQYKLAEERAERRFAKRVRKLARGQERRGRSQMPGSWVE